MQFATPDQFIRFRPTCLCGLPPSYKLVSLPFVNGDYSCGVQKCELSASGDSLILPVHMKSNWGNINFSIIKYLSSTMFEIKAHYTEKVGNKSMPPIELIKKTFPNNRMGIQLVLSCQIDTLGATSATSCGYKLVSNYIHFNYGTSYGSSSGSIEPLTIYSEDYSLVVDDNVMYRVYNTTHGGAHIYYDYKRSHKIEVSSEAVLKLPLNKEILSKKFKTWVLLS